MNQVLQPAIEIVTALLERDFLILKVEETTGSLI